MSLKYEGTGRTFAEVELPDGHGTFVVKDDGDPDTFVAVGIETAGGHKSFRTLRQELADDEQFAEVLQATFAAASGSAASASGGGTSTSFNSAPVFKCNGCNKSWPRRQNQTPNKPEDTCPECAN